MCCQLKRYSDYVDYRIERDDPEIEFENWFPTDAFGDESETWSPSFSIGIGIPETPLSVGIGSIRSTTKKGTVLARSRKYVDWHVNLSFGYWKREEQIPNKQKDSEGVQVDIKPMNAGSGTKELTLTSQYGFLKERQNGWWWDRKTQKLDWDMFVEIE